MCLSHHSQAIQEGKKNRGLSSLSPSSVHITQTGFHLSSLSRGWRRWCGVGAGVKPWLRMWWDESLVLSEAGEVEGGWSGRAGRKRRERKRMKGNAEWDEESGGKTEKQEIKLGRMGSKGQWKRNKGENEGTNEGMKENEWRMEIFWGHELRQQTRGFPQVLENLNLSQKSNVLENPELPEKMRFRKVVKCWCTVVKTSWINSGWTFCLQGFLFKHACETRGESKYCVCAQR